MYHTEKNVKVAVVKRDILFDKNSKRKLKNELLEKKESTVLKRKLITQIFLVQIWKDHVVLRKQMNNPKVNELNIETRSAVAVQYFLST